jgi:DNA-binding transcriptional MerR regulator
VLRYWETEFKTIKPTKSSTGHRVYSKKDVELLAQIRHLLHNENFSIKGAKKKLQDMKAENKEQKVQKSSDKTALKGLHQELKELIAFAKQPL